MNNKLISSKEVIAKFNISYPALTHYTNIGLLRVVGRRGNKRLYDAVQVKQRLPKIRNMIDRGYPLRLIVEALNNRR